MPAAATRVESGLQQEIYFVNRHTTLEYSYYDRQELTGTLRRPVDPMRCPDWTFGYGDDDADNRVGRLTPAGETLQPSGDESLVTGATIPCAVVDG